MKASTAKDVAKRAGVSIATVSRVINNLESVSPEIRDRVLQAIKVLGYRPSRAAQLLRAKRGHVLGLIISDIQNPFFTAVARGIEDVAYQHGYSLVLCNTDEDVEKERLYLDVMRAEAVAGVLLATTLPDDSSARYLLSNGIPVVAIDRDLNDPDVDSVMVDSVHGAVEAVSHLIDLGHRRIGLINGPARIVTLRQRCDGFKLAHERHGLTASPELMRFGSPNQAGGYACTHELLQQHPDITALFSANNLLALGTLAAIQERGLKIPDDISVVCFSDMSWSALLNPPLTAIAQPDYELGQKAAALLLERFDQPDKRVSHVQLDLRLVIRASTGRPR